VTATLLDVNVLMALAWPNHEHHEAAHTWLRTLARNSRWATCTITELGFVRLSSNPKVVEPSASLAHAVEMLRRMLAYDRHVFWADDISASQDPQWLPPWVRGQRQVTDGYLARLALRHHGRLATFDRAVHTAAGDELVILIA
jgi:toxin-antitoxin system PIN domain toxin